MARTPKPLNIPGAAIPAAPQSAPQNGGGPRPLSVPTSTTPPPAPNRNPRPIGGSSGGRVDVLLDRAINADPLLRDVRFRIKPRIEALLKADDDLILNWGERNLVALRTVSQDKSELAARLTKLDISGWLERCKNAASRPPSVMNRIFGSPHETPQYFEDKVEELRRELTVFRTDLKKLHDEVSPDAEDLRMDIAALQIMSRENDFTVDPIFVDGRLRTLIASQQTVLMVMQTLENFKSLCAQHMMNIDNLLQVAIPNWRLAASQR